MGESERALTILVVDDHDSIRLLLAKALRPRGFKVAEANSGVAALTILASMETKPNLVLIDVVMPGMDGPPLAKRIDGLYPKFYSCPDIPLQHWNWSRAQRRTSCLAFCGSLLERKCSSPK